MLCFLGALDTKRCVGQRFEPSFRDGLFALAAQAILTGVEAGQGLIDLGALRTNQDAVLQARALLSRIR